MTKRFLLTVAVLVLTSFVVGCAQDEKMEANVDVTLPKLVIGVMPAVDTAPIFLAREEGYFEDLGLDIDIQVFTNAQDRQSALQTGQIDGAMSDVVALITNVQAGFDIKGTTLTDGMFPVLVRKDFEEKESVSVALMEVSVSNYLADEWLSDTYDLEKVFINEIPARLEMIKNGNIDMGVFPEPVASLGALEGLEKRVFPMRDGYCPDIFVFTGKALSEKSDAIEAFHRAIDQAVEAIVKDEALARKVLVEQLNFNPAIQDKMDLPAYRKTNLPEDTYFERIIEWTSAVLGKEITISPEELIERKFVQ